MSEQRRMGGWNERKSFIILVLLSLVLSLGSFWLSVRQVHESDHKWCSLLNGLTATAIPKPADPKANPSRERSYEFYVILVDLDKSLGCR